MPVLIVDGVMYCQTAAIVAYVAKLAGLSKLTDLEQLTSSMIVESIGEIGEAISKSAFAARSGAEGKYQKVTLFKTHYKILLDDKKSEAFNSAFKTGAAGK